jgi:hypothetical protein
MFIKRILTTNALNHAWSSLVEPRL